MKGLPIEKKKLWQYWYTLQLVWTMGMVILFGIPTLLVILAWIFDDLPGDALLIMVLLMPFLVLFLILLVKASTISQKQVGALKYWVDGSTLRVNYGVYFKRRKAIPLDRITDITLFQGPLMRYFGIWSISIQTAGSTGVEAALQGLKNPEAMRDYLLELRDEASIGTQKLLPGRVR